jgi:hypothetical protein
MSEIQPTKDQKKMVQIFQMYDMYNSPFPNEDFNTFLRNTYLDNNLDIYLKQNESATCSSNVDKIELQEQQKFIRAYINQETPFRGLLVWHGLGSGKTCGSIAVANTFKNKEKVIVLPAALINNFIGDYNRCGKENALFEVGKAKLPIYNNPSGNKEIETLFRSFTSNGKINTYNPTQKEMMFEDKLIIIDESQLLIERITNALMVKNKCAHQINVKEKNEDFRSVVCVEKNKNELNKPNHYIDFYNDLKSLEKSRIICLSGTPIVKTPLELAVLFNIIHGDIVYWEISGITYTNNMQDFIHSIEDEVLLKNIDLKNSVHQGNLITLYKTPFEFVNKLDKPGIVHDPTNSMTCSQFGKTLHIFFEKMNVIEKRRSLFNTDSVDEIMNMNPSEFKTKINGLASYFGNIEKILPRVVLRPNIELAENNLYKYGIGQGNNSMPLYEIRYVNQSELTKKVLDTYGKLNKNSVLKKVVNDLGLVSSNIYQFVYPELLEYMEDNKESQDAVELTKHTKPTIEEKKQDLDMLKKINKDEHPIKKALEKDMQDVYGNYINEATLLAKQGKLNTISQYPMPKNKLTDAIQIGYSDRLKRDTRKIEKIIKQTLTKKNRESKRRSKKVFNQLLNSGFNKVDIPSQNDIDKDDDDDTDDNDDENTELVKNVLNDDKSQGMEVIEDNNVKLIKNKRELFKTDKYSYASEIIRNIWDNHDFNTTYRNQFVINPNSNNLLKQCSPKIFEIVKSIVHNQGKIHLIYSEFLQINIPLVRALQANGFYEYDGSENFDELSPSPRYMFYTGTSTQTDNPNREDLQFTQLLANRSEGKANKYRDILLQNFNSEINNLGEKVQVIIINSAAAEGITIKNVRYVHLLHLPSNMSKLFQIIGRAIRNCTHKSLNESNQTVTPILYLSENDEEKYNEIISINRGNVPFLNMIKESTIDCLLNKQISPDQNCFIENNDLVKRENMWVGYDIIAPQIERDKHLKNVELLRNNIKSTIQASTNAMNKAMIAENLPEEFEKSFINATQQQQQEYKPMEVIPMDEPTYEVKRKKSLPTSQPNKRVTRRSNMLGGRKKTKKIRNKKLRRQNILSR